MKMRLEVIQLSVATDDSSAGGRPSNFSLVLLFATNLLEAR